MNQITRFTNFLLAPVFALLFIFSVTGYAASIQPQAATASCSGISEHVLFQSDSTEGGESEGEGGAGDEGEGKKKEEEEEPDC